MQLDPDQRQRYEKKKKRIIEETYDKPIPVDVETLTIGCELEFLLAWLRHPQSAQMQPNFGKVMVEDALGMSATARCSDPKCDRDFEYRLKVKRKNVNDDDDYSFWQVDEDGTTAMTDEKLAEWKELRQQYRSQFFAIEVKSRILRYDEGRERAKQKPHTHWLSYQAEIAFALQRLHEYFDGRENGEQKPDAHLCCLLTNDLCGFHVHIGNGKGIPMPFETIKRVFSTMVACERQMDRLHSANRIIGSAIVTERINLISPNAVDESRDVGNSFNTPLSVQLLAGAHWQRQKDFIARLSPERNGRNTQDELEEIERAYDVGSWLRLIERQQNVAGLRALLRHDDARCTLCLAHCASWQDNPGAIAGKKLTLEFRQHDGTLEVRNALAFIDLCASLVLKCDRLSSQKFGEMISERGQLRDPLLDPLDFVKWTRAHTSTVDFYGDFMRATRNAMQDRFDEEERRASKVQRPHDDDFWLSREPLRKALSGRIDCCKKDAIEERISMKLTKGGYGQFSEDDLEKLFPSENERDALPHLGLRYRSEVLDPSQVARREGKARSRTPMPRGRTLQRFDEDPEDRRYSEAESSSISHVSLPYRGGSSRRRHS